MIADYYSDEIRDQPTQNAIQSILAQLRAFLNVSFNPDGSLIPASPNVGVCPIGTINMYAGATEPSKWLICDGRQISRAIYKDLFSVIGIAYGSGDGSTTFNIPDLRQRFPLGKAPGGTGTVLGSTGGAIDHTHTFSGGAITTSSDGSHTHTGATGSTAPGTDTQGSHNHTGTTGSESAHTHTFTTGDDNGSTGSAATGALSFMALPPRHQHSGTTDAGSAHSHAISSDGSHSHTVNSHTHAISADGSHSHTATATGTNSTNNPPFQVVNFIILAGV